MIKINNFFDNSNVKCIAEGGVFSIYEHQHDLSVYSNTAMNSYFMEQMNVKKRQVRHTSSHHRRTLQEMN